MRKSVSSSETTTHNNVSQESEKESSRRKTANSKRTICSEKSAVSSAETSELMVVSIDNNDVGSRKSKNLIRGTGLNSCKILKGGSVSKDTVVESSFSKSGSSTKKKADIKIKANNDSTTISLERELVVEGRTKKRPKSRRSKTQTVGFDVRTSLLNFPLNGGIETDCISTFVDEPVSVPLADDESTTSFDFNAISERIESVLLANQVTSHTTSSECSRDHSCLNDVGKVYSGKLPYWENGWLIVLGARQNNLKSINVPFPLSAFTVVTGVSGSGKSSLVGDVLYTTLSRTLSHSTLPLNCCEGIIGGEQIRNVVHVDQSPIGQTPTSNPATYTGLFDMIRTLYAQLPEAKVRGYSARQFSFNVPGGRCEKCEGTGLVKVEMHFLADVWITCDACGGKRYDAGTLQVKYRGKSISDTLDTTCGEALNLFEKIPGIRRILRTLCDVGLDYLPLGQSATTLSGGEAQRVKLAAELSRVDTGRSFYVLDEPTTGLHFEDVKKLLEVLHRLVDLGNTVVVVEHNLDVIKNADWILEIGPEAGLEGGNLVFAGTPEQLLEYTSKWNSSVELQKILPRSYTGEALFPVFERGIFYVRPLLDVRRYWDSVKEATEKTTLLGDMSNSEFALAPWEIDGKRWHLELRTSRSGAACKWDPKILSSVVERLTDSCSTLTANWGARNNVEVGIGNKPSGWFLRATTCDEWLLKLRFRTPKNTFNRDLLNRKLALKPLNEVDEIPLYGSQSRTKIETVGAWQEIELRAFSFEEIDQPEFWYFLDFALEKFLLQVEKIKVNETDLTPWKTKGRDWHFSFLGLYGKSAKPVWTFDLLERIVNCIQNSDLSGIVDWYQKIAIYFKDSKTERIWAQVFTKNTEFICVQVNVEKSSLDKEDITNLGFEPELEQSTSGDDIVYLRFRNMTDFDEDKLNDLLKKAHR